MIRQTFNISLKPPSRKTFLEEECLNIYWKIKNFSYSWKNISSPDFTFSSKKWCLQLQPKDVVCKVICLSPNSENYYPRGEISFLTCDGSQEAVSDCLYLQASKDIIFGQRRSAFLPKDTLTVLCRIKVWNGKGKVSIRSVMGVKRSCFLWNLEKFSEGRYDKLLVENSDQYGEVQFSLKSVGGINSDEQFYIEISRRGGEKCNCILKVSVLDVDGKVLNYVSDEFIFEKEDREQFWRFPPIIRKNKLLACKNLLLPKDKLSLKCDFAITLGEVSDQTVVYSLYEDVIPLLKFSEDLSMHYKEESLPKDLKADLKRILDNETLCDVSLQVGSDVIQTHKNILSARSPVFKAMFTKDMKETNSKTVVIEDLDSDTVRRLLLYMYTDAIHDYQWENIMNLYFAADKYEVLSLKQKCSSFLKENLSCSNVCEALFLADLHQDADLKSVVNDFLSKYESEVFASEAWKELEKNNSSLACQTLREICANKRLD
ncbi:Protein roadkill [Araneus ventricosus]|uniref:Protein roadkill n=1 Tax=Araneus ventricosus TaxID=182803 RepID=A0A4Y2E3I6_ARAVE|nr:Protein roadkill [Araneus ventricosus]